MNAETEINDFIVGFLLRYFRQATSVSLSQSRIDLDTDIELLRLHWALSSGTRNLLDYLISHPHELMAVLETRSREDTGLVRGRIDARATEIRRLMTGHPTTTVSMEPTRTYSYGPNYVLLWVIQYIHLLIRRFENFSLSEDSYEAKIHHVAQQIEKTKRFEGIRHATKELNLGRRPHGTAVTEAQRSRRKIYSLAAMAYRTLQSIESGDETSIQKVLEETLLGPLQVWQRFELLVGLGVATAISNATKERTKLNFIAGGNKEPIAKVGRFHIYWQNRTSAYNSPTLEPSEVITESIISAYGLSASSDRPDIVICDVTTDCVVAVLEAKYFSSHEHESSSALRDATRQIVRYCRGYASLASINDLLDASAIALVSSKDTTTGHAKPFGVPSIITLEDITQQRLLYWAQNLIARLPAEAA